jgi:hypothetical protein
MGKKLAYLLHKSGCSEYKTYHFVCVSDATNVISRHELYTDTQNVHAAQSLSPGYYFQNSNFVHRTNASILLFNLALHLQKHVT